jgi:UDP-glucuronate 4-epimerase
MSKIVLTGGAGFIGSHTTKALLNEGHEVTIIDNFNDYYDVAQKEANVAPLVEMGAQLERIDLRDTEAVARVVAAAKPDKIVHLAARAGVRPSIQDPLLYQEVNIGGTLNLLEAAKQSGVEHFVFASSSSVYGKSKEIPFSEDQRVDHPISPYAATKKAGELLCHNYHDLYGTKTTCLRFFTVYGPAGRPDMAPFLFTDAIANGRSIKRFGDGSSQRDYTYVDDIVSGIMGAVANPFDYEIINLGNHQTVKLSDFISTIEKLLGKEAIIEEYPEQPGDVPLTYASIEKAQKLLGYDPKTDIESGMAKFIEWYRETRETV